ncbi:MAG: DNA repair protein RecO [Bacteroidota bacterium]|nr:DNA repair protein RecO [Bacteroidota bacterium]
MNQRLHHTKGIVIRVVKYGETSLIVTIYTELFGVQSYLVNGVRTSSKKGPGKANLFQPAAILDLVAYHSDLKNLQRLREFRWSVVYQHIFFDVVKNAVALFMVELLQKCLKQPEPNEDLFNFIEDAFMHLDASTGRVVANYPLFFALHLAGFLGFRIQNDQTERTPVLDLREGLFVPEEPLHHESLDQPYSGITTQLLRVRIPEELEELALNQDTRRTLLQAYPAFYIFHVPDFGIMKTLPVLQTMLA